MELKLKDNEIENLKTEFSLKLQIKDLELQNKNIKFKPEPATNDKTDVVVCDVKDNITIIKCNHNSIDWTSFIALIETNIIPDKVFLEGIIRTFDESWREEIKKKIHKIAKATAQAMGGDCEVRIEKGYPFLVNDTDLTERAKKAAITFLGEKQVFDLEMRMTAEDFAFYTQKVPGSFYRLGVGSVEKDEIMNLHSSSFNADERSLEIGMGLMAFLALEELKNKP